MMTTTRKIAFILSLLFIATFTASPVRAAGGGNGIGFNNNGRQRILNRVQQNVIISDEEWSVIEPKLWRIVTLQAALGGDQLNRSANQLLRMINNGQTTVTIDPALTALATDLHQKETDLAAAVADPNTNDSQILIKLRDYRASRDKLNDSLKLARADLTRILTLRQEALLFLSGFLD